MWDKRITINGMKETRGRAQKGMGSMDCSNVGPRSSERWDWRKVKMIKE